MDLYKLYGDPGTASFAPHAILSENAIEHEVVQVDRATGATREEPFLAVNPAGYVPALETPDGEVIYESAAICLYLAVRHRLDDILPWGDDPGLGVFLRSLFYLTNTVQEACKVYYYAGRFTDDPAGAAAVKRRGRSLAMERWAVVDGHLAPPGPHYLGARYTIADIYMTMLADWYPERDEMLDRYPAVRRNFEAVTSRPGLQGVLREHGIID